MPTCGIRSPVVDSLMVGVAEEDMLADVLESVERTSGMLGRVQMRNDGIEAG